MSTVGLDRNFKVSADRKYSSLFTSTQLISTLEIFLVGDSVSTYYKDCGQHTTQHYYAEKLFLVKLALYNLISLPNKLPYIVDGIQYTYTSVDLILQYNFNFMINDLRLHVHTQISATNRYCNSLSTVYPSTI